MDGFWPILHVCNQRLKLNKKTNCDYSHTVCLKVLSLVQRFSPVKVRIASNLCLFISLSLITAALYTVSITYKNKTLINPGINILLTPGFKKLRFYKKPLFLTYRIKAVLSFMPILAFRVIKRLLKKYPSIF